MTSDRRYLQWNTRERLLSGDLNDATALLHAEMTKDITASAASRLAADLVGSSFVLSGGQVVANGVNAQVTISPVRAYKFVGPQPSPYDAQHRLVYRDTPLAIDLLSLVDGANPRWVAIEVAPGSTAELTAVRDIFQPGSSTFLPATVTKIQKPDPTFSTNAGVASANPVLPDGTSGTIPLAYVYLPAGATSVGNDDVYMCRPLVPANALGGIDLVQSVGATTNTMTGVGTVSGGNIPGRAYGVTNGRPWRAGPIFDVTDPQIYRAGEALTPADDSPIYLYALQPPFPVGYDNDINAEWREFRQVSDGSSQKFAIDGRFTNCVVALSTEDPNDFPLTGAQSLSDPTWGSGTSDASTWQYIGAVSWSAANTRLIPQRGAGGGRILMDKGQGGVDSYAFALFSDGASTSETITFDGRLLSETGTTIGLPEHVTRYSGRLEFQSTPTSPPAQWNAKGTLREVNPSASAPREFSFGQYIDSSASGPATPGSQTYLEYALHPAGGYQITLEVEDATNTNTVLVLRGDGYFDPFLTRSTAG